MSAKPTAEEFKEVMEEAKRTTGIDPKIETKDSQPSIFKFNTNTKKQNATKKVITDKERKRKRKQRKDARRKNRK